MAVKADRRFAHFERRAPRQWLDSTALPIRRMFEFQPLKGATYSAVWGFSLDFVPLRRGRRTWRWKRTVRSVELDLCIDPIDDGENVPRWCSFVYLPGIFEPTPTEVTEAARLSLCAAMKDFDRVHSIEDIVAIFEERAAKQFRRFSLENYIQTHIAWGLALVAVGRADEGRIHINAFCDRFEIARDDRLLRRAEAAAHAYAAAMREGR
ncbi:MAG TPA: hypothetical protein VKS60_03755 [Stellaceae bacterium]|nr:hypothetical protein [Stellaceae bacterium]